MKRKIGPYVLIMTLITVLVFIVGVRYGQRVETTNQVVNYLLSQVPSRMPQPTQASLEFKTFTNKDCGVKFLYPNFLEVKSQATFSALLANGDHQLQIDCQKDSQLQAFLEDDKVASQEITFQNKKIIAKITGKNPVYTFKFANIKNLKTIYVVVSKSLYSLFETTLEF